MGVQPTGKFTAAVGLALRWPAGLLEEQGPGRQGQAALPPPVTPYCKGLGTLVEYKQMKQLVLSSWACWGARASLQLRPRDVMLERLVRRSCRGPRGGRFGGCVPGELLPRPATAGTGEGRAKEELGRTVAFARRFSNARPCVLSSASFRFHEK